MNISHVSSEQRCLLKNTQQLQALTSSQAKLAPVADSKSEQLFNCAATSLTASQSYVPPNLLPFDALIASLINSNLPPILDPLLPQPPALIMVRQLIREVAATTIFKPRNLSLTKEQLRLELITICYLAREIYRIADPENVHLKLISDIKNGSLVLRLKKFLADKFPNYSPPQAFIQLSHRSGPYVKIGARVLNLADLTEATCNEPTSITAKGVRQIFLQPLLTQEKRKALNYFIQLIAKIKNNYASSIANRAIIQITTYLIIVNVNLRHKINGKLSHQEYLKMAEPIFTTLAITKRQEQEQFVHACRMATTHRHKFVWLKRLFVTIVGIGLGALIVLCPPIAAIAMLCTAVGSLALITALTYLAASFTNIPSIISITKYLNQWLNCGDRLSSLCKTHDLINGYLAAAYATINDDESYNSSHDLKLPYLQRYQQVAAWLSTPRSDKMVKFLRRQASARIPTIWQLSPNYRSTIWQKMVDLAPEYGALLHEHEINNWIEQIHRHEPRLEQQAQTLPLFLKKSYPPESLQNWRNPWQLQQQLTTIDA